MTDRSMVSYSDSDDGIDHILINKRCRDIVNDIISIYRTTHNEVEILKKIGKLLTKYHNHYLVYYFIGKYYSDRTKYDLAINSYKICTEKYPLIDAYLDTAVIHHKCNDIAKTKEVLETALKHDPKEIRILNFYGVLYYMEKNYYTAIDHFEKVVRAGKKKTASMKHLYNNLGFSCSAVGKCKKALGYFDTGLNIVCKGDNNKINVQLLQNKLLNHDYMFKPVPNAQKDYIKINDYLGITKSCTRTISNTGKIRLGLVSPDFRSHVCMIFMNPILKNIDTKRFEIYCYANVWLEDVLSESLKNNPNIKWFNIFNKDVDDVCTMIHSHKIDVLIDLAGHTNANRLDVFSKKPAPIQMTYLGFPNTTGMHNIDYRITDGIADPPDTNQFYTEKLLRLPRCFICYNNDVDVPIKINTNPMKQIVFGVTNKINKHNKFAFKAWSEIIKRVPGSVLLIKRDIQTTFDIKVKYLKKTGLREDQLHVVGHINNRDGYYDMYNNIDIALDTFPYSGTTTSCDTLIMSTPIVTLSIKDRHVSNVTKSILYNIGLNELVADSVEDYIEKAIKLAEDHIRIQNYKKTIRNKFMNLMNPVKFADDFYNTIWNKIRGIEPTKQIITQSENNNFPNILMV